MNLAKVSCNGQITVPLEIRRALQLKSGDKIIFLYKNDGDITIKSLNTMAISEATQKSTGFSFTDKMLAQA
ncbi:MAG: AbrB/MazE/SpoVT family DNA-binding domain-containing protein [Defluviitaleaceae bacterium]|nr:AbrB/MazE/SpoVT family DNA-binding domain-containing protein [Defluviitaleaceae bacterium]